MSLAKRFCFLPGGASLCQILAKTFSRARRAQALSAHFGQRQFVKVGKTTERCEVVVFGASRIGNCVWSVVFGASRFGKL